MKVRLVKGRDRVAWVSGAPIDGAWKDGKWQVPVEQLCSQSLPDSSEETPKTLTLSLVDPEENTK
jgi:hypothetical protein